MKNILTKKIVFKYLDGNGRLYKKAMLKMQYHDKSVLITQWEDMKVMLVNFNYYITVHSI